MKLTIALALFIAAIAGVCGFIHQRNQTAAREKTALAAQQSEQIANLQSEQQRLSALGANSTKSSHAAPDDQAELASLRAQAESLRKQTNRMAKQAKAASAASSPGRAPETHPPEYWQELRQAAGNKSWDARDIATAAYMYAMDHKSQLPTNLNQVARYLSRNGRTTPITNRFEFVFAGSLDQLKGIPNTSIALVRDTETWTTSDGKQARVYGMVGGTGQTVISDDNFQSWEAEHVISPPPQLAR